MCILMHTPLTHTQSHTHMGEFRKWQNCIESSFWWRFYMDTLWQKHNSAPQGLYLTVRRLNGTYKMAQRVKAIAAQAWQLEFNHWNSGKDGGGDQPPQTCPLAFTCMAWHAHSPTQLCMDTFTHTHTQIKLSDFIWVMRLAWCCFCFLLRGV